MPELVLVGAASIVTSGGSRGDMLKVGFRGMGWPADAMAEGQIAVIKNITTIARINERGAMWTTVVYPLG
jgi:hypothetical protein